jgi:isopentenyl-diphosphate Delta-isomerase
VSRITVVDKDDNVIGAEERSVVRAHGLYCRIARILLINSRGELLLQRRSLHVKESPGKWDQSVGGHVDEGENYEQAAQREALEELGVPIKQLKPIGKFLVEREASDGYIRRFQTVFLADWDGPITANKDEVAETRWVASKNIENWLKSNPNDFTGNFNRVFALYQKYTQKTH